MLIHDWPFASNMIEQIWNTIPIHSDGFPISWYPSLLSRFWGLVPPNYMTSGQSSRSDLTSCWCPLPNRGGQNETLHDAEHVLESWPAISENYLCSCPKTLEKKRDASLLTNIPTIPAKKELHLELTNLFTLTASPTFYPQDQLHFFSSFCGHRLDLVMAHILSRDISELPTQRVGSP